MIGLSRGAAADKLLKERDLVRSTKDEIASMASEAGKRLLDKVTTTLARQTDLQDKVQAFAKQNSNSRAHDLLKSDGKPALDDVQAVLLVNCATPVGPGSTLTRGGRGYISCRSGAKTAATPSSAQTSRSASSGRG